MKILITIIANLIICIGLFFFTGLFYVGIYGTGGEYNANRVFIFECLYFLIGIIHIFILYLKLDRTKYNILLYLILFLLYLYMAFFFK